MWTTPSPSPSPPRGKTATLRGNSPSRRPTCGQSCWWSRVQRRRSRPSHRSGSRRGHDVLTLCGRGGLTGLGGQGVAEIDRRRDTSTTPPPPASRSTPARNIISVPDAPAAGRAWTGAAGTSGLPAPTSSTGGTGDWTPSSIGGCGAGGYAVAAAVAPTAMNAAPASANDAKIFFTLDSILRFRISALRERRTCSP